MQASSQDNTNKEIEKDYLQYIWKYFELHAIQRITLFRYYIIFFSLYGYAIAHFSIKHTHTNQESKEAVLFIVIFSVIFFLITCMFMFLDHRNKVLIHHAEDAFKKYEEVFKEIDSK